MRVHVVCTGAPSSEGRILPRLATGLADRLGWTASNRPDSSADVQYWWPYLEQHADWQGPQAAWFTHKEERSPKKAARWEATAASVHLRTTSAPMYVESLMRHGATRLVTPPLDLGKFSLAAESKRSAGRVGVSGYIYTTGRKGAELVVGLSRGRLRGKMELVAAGSGWPVTTREYRWAELQDFYQSLGVYVCTSTVEGVPYPPLEALACGTPTVVPKGVGLLDSLPDLPGLRHYERGDLADLERALEQVLSEAVDRAQLRSVAEHYTWERCVSQHLAAFAQFGASETPRQWRGKAGVYMVAYGEPARKCAAKAIETLHKSNPALPVCLVGTRPLDAGETFFVAEPEADIGARSVKTSIYDLAPKDWEYVLYLDSDVEVLQPLDSVFGILADGWDFVIVPNPTKYATARMMTRPDNRLECNATFEAIGTEDALQYNGGVFGFRRCEGTARLLRAWHREWNVYGSRDQAALDRALYAGPVRVWTLSNQYNRVTHYDPVTKDTVIAHYPRRARRWSGLLHGRKTAAELGLASG